MNELLDLMNNKVWLRQMESLWTQTRIGFSHDLHLYLHRELQNPIWFSVDHKVADVITQVLEPDNEGV